LWGVFSTLIMYLSAIFYDVSTLELSTQKLLLLNPVYVYISFFRSLVLNGSFPDLTIWLLSAVYALIFFAVGLLIYKKFNHKFLYYV
jgi:ABC-2 type transport system permease protein